MRKAKLVSLCSNCEKETEFELITNEEIIKVRKEPIKVQVQYSKCKNCGDEVLDPNSNLDPFNLAYREYREKHSLLQPDEIRDWRKAQELTQSELAKLLGVGIATISRYENGSLQDQSHDRLMRLAMNPSNLLKLVEKSGDLLGKERKNSLLTRLRDLQTKSCSIDSAISINLANYEPDEFSGYRTLDLEKLYNMILFFSKPPGVFKTKLNKLLFYADFRHFRDFTLSISGTRYAHVPFGPAPDEFSIHYGFLNSKGNIESTEWEGYYSVGDEPIVGEIITAKKQPNLNLFEERELDVMLAVKKDLGHMSSKELSDLSHDEDAYRETQNGDLISYTYANRLRH